MIIVMIVVVAAATFSVVVTVVMGTMIVVVVVVAVTVVVVGVVVRHWKEGRRLVVDEKTRVTDEAKFRAEGADAGVLEGVQGRGAKALIEDLRRGGMWRGELRVGLESESENSRGSTNEEEFGMREIVDMARAGGI